MREYLGGERSCRDVILDAIEHRDDVHASVFEALTLGIGKRLPELAQLTVELSCARGQRDHASARVMTVADIGHDSICPHVVGNPDDGGVCQSKAVSELRDCKRPLSEKKLIGRCPTSAKGQPASLVQLLSGAQERVRHATKAVIEDERAEASNEIHVPPIQ